jgi:hypothetical protein
MSQALPKHQFFIIKEPSPNGDVYYVVQSIRQYTYDQTAASGGETSPGSSTQQIKAVFDAGHKLQAVRADVPGVHAEASAHGPGGGSV